MAKIRLVGTGTFANTHTTPKRPYSPLDAPLVLPTRFLGGPKSGKYPTATLCSNLAVYGCNVHPMRAGTTGGEHQIASRRNVSKFVRI